MIKEKVIVDTDPGVDDATALTILMFNDKVDIKLITTTAGNVGIGTTTKNALFLVEKFNKNIPIAVGADKPLNKPCHYASNIHGIGGLGGFTDITVTHSPISEDAVDSMYKVIKENPNEITILELAPHTNLAMLFKKHPDAIKLIKQIIFEGGSPYGKENVKPHISFNISFDPDAANMVINSKVKKTLVPSELGRYIAPFSSEQVEIIKNTNKTGEFLAKMFEGYKSKYILNSTETNDLGAIMYFLYPEIFTTYNCNIKVDTTTQLGKTTITETNGGLITFVESTDKDKFFELFLTNLKNINI